MSVDVRSVQETAAQLLDIARACNEMAEALEEIRDRPGARSKVFLSGPTGRQLVAKTAEMARCGEASLELATSLMGGNNELACGIMRYTALELGRLLAGLTNGGERPMACILAPMFSPDTITDGYVRRIANIDSLIPDGMPRLYVNSISELAYPTVESVDDDHLYLQCSSSCDNAPLFDVVAEYARLVYCHSVFAFDEALVERCSSAAFVLDFHGVVPEEASYMKQEQDVVSRLEQRETQAVSAADVIICVTGAMADHIKRKHPALVERTEFVVLPILDAELCNSRQPKPSYEAPTAVYAGGTAPWQMLDKTFDAMSSQPGLCSYKVFIPQPDRFDRLWGDRPLPEKIEVGVRSPDELPAEYRQCHYGFVLRDDCVVNNVACPTKLVEYIANDVIPVVLSPNIGDFLRDGMAFIGLDDFMQGNLPDEGERNAMLARNRSLLEKQLGRFEDGKKQVLELFAAAGRLDADEDVAGVSRVDRDKGDEQRER